MQKDPDPGELTLLPSVLTQHSYAGNDPINFEDPSGRSFIRTVTAFVGGPLAGPVFGAIFGGLGNASDSSGVDAPFWKKGLSVLTGAIIGAATAYAAGAVFVATLALSPFITPFAAIPLAVVATSIVGGAGAAANNAVNQFIYQGKITSGKRVSNAFKQGALTTALGIGAGYGANYIFGSDVKPIVEGCPTQKLILNKSNHGAIHQGIFWNVLLS